MKRSHQAIASITMRCEKNYRFDTRIIRRRHIIRARHSAITMPGENHDFGPTRHEKVDHVFMIHGGRFKLVKPMLLPMIPAVHRKGNVTRPGEALTEPRKPVIVENT
jgi:hypothetical protein